MSKNIEDIFRSSLENHEESYDASAWNSISEKLDSKSESINKSKKSNWSTYSIVAAGIVIGGYLLLNRNENQIPKIISKEKEKQNETIILEKNDQKNIIIPKENTYKKNQIHKTIITSTPQKQIEKSLEITPKIDSNNENKESKKVLQVTARAIYCQGERETFKNENDFTIYLIHQSGKHFTIKQNDKLTIELNETGDYFWSIENTLNTENKMHAFEVITSTKINFNLPQELDYSKGIPNIQLTTNSKGNNKWYLNGKPYSQGKDVELTIFNKGLYEIKLVNEFNGCQTEIVKTFNSYENYNLMSVNGIDPNHSDPKRNSFIPYALTLRNVNFRMLIISPTTGEVIFETNDIEKPWRGQNQKTDELVPENSEYIWKVIIYNPEKGEKSEYKGRVTRI